MNFLGCSSVDGVASSDHIVGEMIDVEESIMGKEEDLWSWVISLLCFAMTLS